MITLKDILEKDKDLKLYYEKSNEDIRAIIINIFNACFRFGLTDMQTIYMINQAISPLKTDLMVGMLR